MGPKGIDKTEGVARISWINRLGPHNLKFKVS